MSYRDIKEYYYEDIMIRDDTHYHSHQDVKDTLDEIEEYWTAYLKWTSEKDIDKDKEIKAVLEWNSKYAVEEE